MRWRTGVPVCVVVTLAAVACTSSSRTAAPTPTEAFTPKDLWSHVTFASGPAAGVRAAAVIDGFRVHPDPDENGVIHVVAGGERVVVNASDIASRPPADQSYLVVNWDDGPNQRVGCGPCRADHDYAAGRYTLVASLDGTGRDRSISVQVQVSPREKKEPSRLPAVGFQPDTIVVGQTTYLFISIPPPPGITGGFPFLDCSPSFGIIGPSASPPLFVPGGVGLPITGVATGTCVATYTGTDANGPFAEAYVLTIN